MVLISGGVGVTPMISMANALVEGGSTREIWFFFGARNSREHMFKDAVEALAARHANVRPQICYSKPAAGDVKGRDYHHEGRVTADGVARLFEDGVLCGVKYAIPRANPAEDTLLKDLVTRIGNDRIVSGMGERPAVAHLKTFNLAAFTSGLVCIAPRTSNSLLAAIRRGDWTEAERIRAVFRPLEDLRNAISPIRVLHRAVAGAGIADTGPLLPLLDAVEPEHVPAIDAAARALLAADRVA